MPMTYEEVQPDTRVLCHSRGEIAGTVQAKYPDGFGEDRPIVRIEFDNGGTGYNYPEQLSPLDEPAPEPKLRRAGTGKATFWLGGTEYLVWNITGVDVPGMWACAPRPVYSNTDRWVVTKKKNRRTAFATAVAELRSRTTDSQ